MKRLLYQFHSWLGLLAGLGLLVVGLTGSALVFKEDIDALTTPEIVKLPGPPKPPLGPDEFLEKIQANLPGYQVTGWGRALTAGMADRVYAMKLGESEGKMIYVDPANGLPRTTDLAKNETFTDWLLLIHYAFLADHAGMFIVGIFGVLLCFLGITGVWIYRGFWKTLFRLRWKKSARIFFSDVHKMVGISSTVFNLLLGFTGAWWNISHVTGEWMAGAVEPVARTDARAWAPNVSISSLLVASQAKIPGFHANWIDVPMEEGGEIVFFGSIKGQGPLRSQYGSSITFDGATGEVKSAMDIRRGTVWEQILDAFQPLHYGTFGGLPVKILWSLGGLAPAILAISGALMWWKRKMR